MMPRHWTLKPTGSSTAGHNPSRAPNRSPSRRLQPARWFDRRTRPTAVLSGATVALLCGIALGGGVEVTVRSVEHDDVRGRLVSFSAEDGLTLRADDGNVRRMDFDNVVRIEFDRRRSPPRRTDSRFGIAHGDVLFGTVAERADDGVVIDSLDLGRVVLPLDRIISMDSPRAREPAYRKSVAWLDREQETDEDRVLATNGDVLRGFVSAVGPDGVSIESAFGETLVPLRLAVAVRLASGSPPPPPEKPYVVVTLRSSGRVTLHDMVLADNVANARFGEAQALTIEAERLAGIEVVGGRWEWLSDHTPISFEQTPMLLRAWDYQRNRNVLGGPIRVAGESFERGIGVHSRSSLTFDLKGKYGKFETFFGLDDESGDYADVSVSILVDGRPVFRKSGVRHGTLHGPIRVDVSGAGRIELVVDFGENGDIQDRFNWIEPALVR